MSGVIKYGTDCSYVALVVPLLSLLSFTETEVPSLVSEIFYIIVW